MIIKNKFIPFGDYKVMNLFGILLTKQDLTEIDKNHEMIHTKQIIECAIILFTLLLILVIFGINPWWLLISPAAFYIWYVIEYLLIRVFNIKDEQSDCYHDISLEEEAHINKYNMEYLKTREAFAWLEYIKIGSYDKINT